MFLLQMGADNENHIRVGKLNLVDLAGSERQAKTGAEVRYHQTRCGGDIFSLMYFYKSRMLISCPKNVILIEGSKTEGSYKD